MGNFDSCLHYILRILLSVVYMNKDEYNFGRGSVSAPRRVLPRINLLVRRAGGSSLLFRSFSSTSVSCYRCVRCFVVAAAEQNSLSAPLPCERRRCDDDERRIIAQMLLTRSLWSSYRLVATADGVKDSELPAAVRWMLQINSDLLVFLPRCGARYIAQHDMVLVKGLICNSRCSRVSLLNMCNFTSVVIS